MFRRFTAGTANVVRVGTRASLDGIGTLRRAATMATCTRIPIGNTAERRFLIMAIGTGGESGEIGSGINATQPISPSANSQIHGPGAGPDKSLYDRGRLRHRSGGWITSAT